MVNKLNGKLKILKVNKLLILLLKILMVNISLNNING